MTYRVSILEMVAYNDQQPNDTAMDTMEERTTKVVKRGGLMASVPFLDMDLLDLYLYLYQALIHRL